MARPHGPSRQVSAGHPRATTPEPVPVLLGLGAILVATGLAYAPALRGPFVLDDRGSIEANLALRAADAVRLPSPVEMLGPSRPLTEVTFAVDWRAAGPDPFRYHVVSLALHLVTVIVAFAFLASILRRVGHARPRAVALVVTGIFALHPIQAESVAYAAQRSEVLASLFYLLTLVLLDRAARGWPGRGAALSWAGGGATWLLGMGAKAIAISAPGAFLLDQAVLAPAGERGAGPLRRRAARALGLAAPLLALAGVSAWLQLRSFAANPAGGVGFSETPLGPWAYLLTQFRVSWLYLRLLAWPQGFAFDRTFTPSTGLDVATVASGACLLALVLLAGLLWRDAEREPGGRPAGRLVAFGILFWLVVLSPSSSVVPVVDLAVEHRVYLASLGPFLAVVVALDALLARLPSRRQASVAGAVLASSALLALSLALAARARTWGSAESLLAESAAVSPDSARVWINLGNARDRGGDRAGAEAAYVRAWSVVRRPDQLAILARNHAALLLSQDRAAEALALLDRATATVTGDAGLHAARAAALGRLGRSGEALAEARRAAAAAPGDPAMRNVLGQALSVKGDPAGALAEFRAAEALDPGAPLYPAEAGVTLSALGRLPEACAAFARATALSGSRPAPLDAAARAAALGCPPGGSR